MLRLIEGAGAAFGRLMGGSGRGDPTSFEVGASLLVGAVQLGTTIRRSDLIGDQYLNAIRAREAVDTSFLSPTFSAKATLMPVINAWGGSLVQSVTFRVT